MKTKRIIHLISILFFTLALVLVCAHAKSVLASGPNTDTYPMIAHKGDLYFARQGQIWRSVDHGRCWEHFAEFEIDRADIRSFLNLDEYLLIGTYRTGLWRLEGDILQPEPNDYLRITEKNRHVFTLASLSEDVVLIGASGQSGTSQNGLWIWNQRWSEGLWSKATDSGFEPGVSVFSLAVDRDHPEGEALAYVGTDRGGIFRGSLGGGWSLMPTARDENGGLLLSGVQVQALAIGGNPERRILFAGGGSTELRNKGIYRFHAWLEDARWEDAGGGVIGQDIAVWTLVTDPDREQGIWAHTELGLFYSPNAGDDWVRILPLSRKSIQGLLVHDAHLYVLTWDGLYFSTLAQARRQNGVWMHAEIASRGMHCTDLVTSDTPTPAPTTTRTPASIATSTLSPTATVTPSSAESTPTQVSPWEGFKQGIEDVADLVEDFGVVGKCCAGVAALLIVLTLVVLLLKRGRSLESILNEFGDSLESVGRLRDVLQTLKDVLRGKTAPSPDEKEVEPKEGKEKSNHQK